MAKKLEVKDMAIITSDDNLSDRVSLINKIVSVIKEETEDEEDEKKFKTIINSLNII